jgi:hypothetical protein
MGEFETALTQVAGTLNRLKLPYMLTGAVAVTYYGAPRTTHDIDMVILISPADIPRLKAALEPDFSVDEVSVKAALREGSMFNAIHEETGFKVDFWMLKGGEYDQTAFARRVQAQLLGAEMFLPAPEDVIIAKLEWHRMSDMDKHYSDAQGVAAVQKCQLDTAYIARWCEAKSLTDLWHRIERETSL